MEGNNNELMTKYFADKVITCPSCGHESHTVNLRKELRYHSINGRDFNSVEDIPHCEKCYAYIFIDDIESSIQETAKSIEENM